MAATSSLKVGKIEDLTADFELSKPVVLSNGKYTNPWDSWQEKTIMEVIGYMFSQDRIAAKPLTDAEYDKFLKVLKPDFSVLNNPPKEDIQCTWIGHASVLVQVGGLNFLTDPVFCERASPVQWAGPKRVRKTPCKLEELPKIDFVLISHNHYDHLDHSVVTGLGNSTHWFVPFGEKKWFLSCGIKESNITELKWWQQATINDNFKIISTPAQHWSKRQAHTSNTSLWSSWVVQVNEKKVFFSGDTGYCTAFKEIGKLVGPIDLSLIAIGAYCPRNFMKPQHINPEEAVQMHLDIGSKLSFGIHWGTFILTTEPQDEPPKLIKEELKKRNMKENEFITSHIGETFTASKILGLDTTSSKQESKIEEL